MSDREIRDAARDVFLKKGASVSVAEIAKKLGVSHAAIFSRAKSKEALMLQALSPGAPQVLARLEAPVVGDPLIVLRDFLAELLLFMREAAPGLLVLKSAGLSMASTMPPGAPPPPVIMRKALTRWLKRHGSTPDKAELHAELLLSAVEARAFTAYLGESEGYLPTTDKAFVRRLLTLLG